MSIVFLLFQFEILFSEELLLFLKKKNGEGDKILSKILYFLVKKTIFFRGKSYFFRKSIYFWILCAIKVVWWKGSWLPLCLSSATSKLRKTYFFLDATKEVKPLIVGRRKNLFSWHIFGKNAEPWREKNRWKLQKRIC